ncbi:NAD(P)/FAD-dependent oxidoreductase [Brevibacillus centrosporus]|uniref:2,4-dienoyl-CoA reductase n=1 Tax=Brevibacillus centrosporus TaxID=54910 RepID=A0A1I4E476_9BACL|nr:NAD(P)/FAD-dependent oxidoreductase [Brevibacillus centrosporus]SFK99959.1 2,4-dienoyl-CoA reductase [Brevibacillus centrosporus]
MSKKCSKLLDGYMGLIIVENVCVDFPLGSNGTTQLRIDHDRYIPKLYQLTETIHRHGACVAIQLNHAGGEAVPSRIGDLQPVSASDIPSDYEGAIPRPLEIEEIYQIADSFAKAAKRVKIAGFDAVEIHAGHSYLICQFLSPLYNKRTDEFGGSLENRTRFAKIILEIVREAVGANFPISFRFSADDFSEGGNTLEDTLKMLEYLESEIDLINVSAGVNESMHFQIDHMSLADGWRSYLARAFKQKYKKPTMTTGNIHNPLVAEEILTNGDADLIGSGRGLIADPKWPLKLLNNQNDDIRKCISCNIGCSGHRMGLNRPIRCTVNPDLINDDEYKKHKVKKHTNVVVIGAGTAGLEAACTAAEVGCQVFLFEENKYLGGLATEMSRLPEKRRIADFPEYLKKRSEKLRNLIIFAGQKASIEQIENLKPDIIVNATGAKVSLPPIKGIAELVDKKDSNIFSIKKFLDSIDDFQEIEQKRVLIAGGGSVGLDVLEYFAHRGAAVTIFDRSSEIGRDLDIVSRTFIFQLMRNYKVDVLYNTTLIEVNKESFSLLKNGNIIDEYFDYGFVCLGMESENALLTEVQDYFKQKKIEIINIGDSRLPRKILEGVQEGRDIIMTLRKLERL